MASYDRKFEIIRPTLDRLMREPLEVSDARLVDPNNTAVVPLIDGELVQVTAEYKWNRASDNDVPSFFCIEDRGDYGVQASKRLTAIMGPSFVADTIVYDTALVTLGEDVMIGTVSNTLSGSVNRAGLVAVSAGLVLGYVLRVAANNGGRLRIIQTLV